MPWEANPTGWYAFARGSHIHLRKGPKNWLADVSVYKEDSLDKRQHSTSFKARDKETVALRALAYLQSTTGRRPVQIDLRHGDPYPVSVRTEDDEIKEVVDYGLEVIKFDEDVSTFLMEKK